MPRLPIIFLLILSLALSGCRSSARVDTKAEPSQYAGYEVTSSSSPFDSTSSFRRHTNATLYATGAVLLVVGLVTGVVALWIISDALDDAEG